MATINLNLENLEIRLRAKGEQLFFMDSDMSKGLGFGKFILQIYIINNSKYLAIGVALGVLDLKLDEDGIDFDFCYKVYNQIAFATGIYHQRIRDKEIINIDIIPKAFNMRDLIYKVSYSIRRMNNSRKNTNMHNKIINSYKLLHHLIVLLYQLDKIKRIPRKTMKKNKINLNMIKSFGFIVRCLKKFNIKLILCYRVIYNIVHKLEKIIYLMDKNLILSNKLLYKLGREMRKINRNKIFARIINRV
jgi:hypothetical protein